MGREAESSRSGILRARIAEGYAEDKDEVEDAHGKPGTLNAMDAMRFVRTTNMHGEPVKVRDIELTFCVPERPRGPDRPRR